MDRAQAIPALAQFAFGLTKAVVEGTVSTVKSAIEEERKLRDDVQRDLEFITAEFQMMQSFLNNVANAGESQVMLTWVRLLRDLAFDVEDWVEFVSHMDDKGSSLWAWCRRMLMQPCPCLARPQDLDLAAAEMKLLKARVKNVSQRSKRYNLITSGGSDPALAATGGSGSHSRSKHAAAAMPAEQMVAGASVNPLAFGILRKMWEAAGTNSCGMLNLQRIITTEGGLDRQVISVWGSTGGDLGMTSVIREAYCDARVLKEFRARAWVKLADPFNLQEFLHSLVTQLRKSRSHHHHGDGDAAGVCFRTARVSTEDVDGLMKQQLLLMKEKYLIVLEDVSTVVQWDDIKMHLPDYKNGSRIVVSTHDIGMAFMCTGKPYLVSELRRLPDGHSLGACWAPEIPIGVDKFIKEITCSSVISVWGSSRAKSIFVDKVYRSIIMHNDKREEHNGGLKLKFETRGWVHVPDYWFDLKLISRQLYLDLCSSGGSAYNDETKHANETVDAIEEAALIQKCCEFLRERTCLVVIDGLRSTGGWDLFENNFLSHPIRGCIIVITNDEKVAKHCAKKGQVIKIKEDLEVASTAEIFSIRKEKARNWTKTVKIGESHQELALSFSMLLQDPGVVSVWGFAGVGKTYLVRTSYYHHMLRSWGQLFTVNSQTIWLDIRKEENNQENEFTAFSWVNVPRPFSLMTFSRRLLVGFCSDDLQAMEAVALSIMQGQDLYEECRKLLRREKYFLVIDGLRSTDEWDMIKHAFFPKRVDSCVVIITDEAKVARHCQVDEARRVNVKAFQADEARNLFMEVVWKNKQLTQDEMVLSKRILSKCGGLPEVISAIGEYCRLSKDQLKHLSDDFMGSLEINDQGFHRLRGLLSWMKYYFDYACSDTLKPCIFYLSVFPVGYNIRRRRLLRRFIAEGYCRDKTSTTAEEEGEMLLSELISLSIIQVQHTPRKILELNGFFREYLVSRPMEGNLVFALKGKCSVNSQRTGQHLTIRRNWDRDRIVFESINFSRLRSFTVSGEWKPFFVSANNNMRLLRVLDLENSSGVTNDDLEQIVELLHRLKFLSLRGCREITRLPDSLGSLRQLHTLDVRYTSIPELPLVIIKLEKLQYINAGTTESWDLTRPTEAAEREDQASTSLEEDGDGTVKSLRVPAANEAGKTSTPPPWSSRAHQLVSDCCLANKFHRIRKARAHHDGSIKVPGRIGKLTALQALGVVNVTAAGGKAISKELKKLTQLRKLRVSGISKENYQELFSAISGHAHLESLSMRLVKDQEGGFCCLDDISEPPRNLKSLKLYGHVHRLPTWMKQLEHLSKVDLEMTISVQEGTRFYEQIPARNIQGRISVKPVGIGERQIHFSTGKYWSYWTKPVFRVFRIDCTSSLEVAFADDNMTFSVELLVVQCSAGGSSLRISGLDQLCFLKEVWLKGSYSHKFWQELKQQLSKHPRKPVLKPERPPFVLNNGS